MRNRSIVILAGRGESTNIIYHALKNDFCIETIILEDPMPQMQFLRKRAQKLGIIKVIGQILFRIMVVPFLKKISYQRIAELKQRYTLNSAPIDERRIVHVPSVNRSETISILSKIDPDIVIVNGTRIISEKVLGCVPAKFVNIHAGITPAYRGVHGAYWALVERNKNACGVTVHLVDTGIDSGNILEQGLITPTKEDSFVTYPLLQLGEGIPLLKKVIADMLVDKVNVKSPLTAGSKLWHHPTLWEYLWYKMRYRVS